VNTTIRKALIAGGLGVTALVGGALGGSMLNGVASAQTATTTPDSSATAPAQKPAGPHAANGKTETELTGTDAEKAEAAALAANPGATIDRVETDADGDTYEAHITKADGTRATVKMDENFKVTSTEEGGPGGRGGPGHMRGTPITAEETEKAKAAALDAVPGGTFDHAFKADDGTIHAHVTKADGTHVHVAMDKDYKVTSVTDAPARGPRGPRPADDASASSTTAS
jgi:uncharacterized membrane protein YkoI